MSNLLFLDESNGNGVYASKSNSPAKLSASASIVNTNNGATATASQVAALTKANNFDNIMAATNTAAAAAAVAAATLTASVSNEDLSLSEYTDADESISAPTEFLAEFLSAVMLKDYKKALKYCKLILQYEPNNATAKEFYPLILEKLRAAASSDSDENYNKSSSPDFAIEFQSAYLSAGESDEAASDDRQQPKHEQRQQQQAQQEDSDECHALDEHYSGEVQTSNSSGFSGDGGGGESLSSVSMEEDDDDDDIDDDDVDDDDDVADDDEDEDASSSSGDDLPIDGVHLSLDNASVGLDNASHSSHNSSSGAEGGRSRSDNTTHSYSSLLLEEEDDILPANMPFVRDKDAHELDVSNGNNVPSTSCSDSESPTEPLTQRLAAMLLSKCGVSSTGENY